MGYNHFRYARRIGTNVSIGDPLLSQPNITMYDAGSIQSDFGSGDNWRLRCGTTRCFRIEYASNVTTLTGGEVTGDTFELNANTIDIYPFVRLTGDGAIYLMGKQQIDLGINNVLGGRFKLGGDNLGGALLLKETTTPVAVADYGAIYTKADNHLYWQSGAGVEYDLGGA